jgi:hypothetical protein
MLRHDADPAAGAVEMTIALRVAATRSDFDRFSSPLGKSRAS